MEDNNQIKKSKRIKRISLSIVAIVFAICGGIVGWLYKVYFVTPIGEDVVRVYITPNMSADMLQSTLASQLKDSITARRIVDFMYNDDYDPTKRKGYYEVSGNASIYRAARKLIAGSETPIKFTFNNLRLKEQLIERADECFYMESDSLRVLLTDATLCASYGFDTTTIVAMFLPDTYEFYWTVTPRRFVERMYGYYNSFWDDDRKAKAARIGLTPIQVSILASIVEEETSKKDEMPVVAGLYINRLNRNIPLQADPTVKFAVGDFSLRRILNKHLTMQSPYNTYLNTGLPPGPIRIPSKAAIDAVLNHAKHNYLYMCAKEDFSGYHNFAKTLGEHNRNAERYHAALNRRGIK